MVGSFPSRFFAAIFDAFFVAIFDAFFVAVFLLP